MKIFSQWILIGLTMVNFQHLSTAWAVEGNGADHGGGDGTVTLAGMLPKSIIERVEIDYTQGEMVPLITWRKCGLFNLASCYEAPEKAVVDLTLNLNAQTLRYEVTNLKGHYQLGGRDYPLVMRVGQADNGRIEIGFDDYGTRHYKARPNNYRDEPNIIQHYYPQEPEIDHRARNNFALALLELGTAPFQARFWVDSAPDPIVSQDLSIILARIRGVLIAQTDLADPVATRTLIKVLNTDMGNIYGQLGGLPGFNIGSLASAEGAILNRLRSDSQGLLQLGHSAINAQGGCDLSIYEELLTRLEHWTLGSPAYFYELSGENAETMGVISYESQAKAAGIRQKLRLELVRTVVPYCERQGTGRSKVDALLND